MADRFAPLADRYGSFAPVVRREGGTHPVAIEELTLGRRSAGVESVPVDRVVTVVGTAGSSPVPLDDRLLAAGQPHRAALDRQGTRLHDGPVLVLDRVAGGRILAAPSSYFAMVATCDALRAEYLDAGSAGSAGRAGAAVPLALRLVLPLRQLADAAAAPDDPLHSGHGRAAAIGLSVVTTVPSVSGRAFLVGRRRPDLATDPGLWHVAPSGMLEPAAAGGSVSSADPLVPAARQELAEELGVVVGGGVVGGGDRALGPRLQVLGVAYDLLRLRPEVCLRLDLTAAEAELVRAGGTRGRGAGAAGGHGARPEFEGLELVDISDAGLRRFWEERPPGSVTAPATGAVALLERSASSA